MRVYVARIPPECDESQLRQLFEPVGQIKSIVLKSSKGDHVTNYAFIEFASEADANYAVKYMNNFQVGDYKLLVNIRKKEGSTSGNGSSGSNFGGFKSITEKTNFKPNTNAVRGRGGFGSRGGMQSSALVTKNENMQNGFGSSNNHSFEENGWDDECENENESTQSLSNLSKDQALEEKVLITHVESLATFWAQPISKDNAGDLNEIEVELIKECKNPRKLVDQWEPGKIYGCKYSYDNQWYRCKAEQHADLGNHMVKVRYIDYGNSEMVNQDNLIELPVSLQEKPPCAKEYRLDIVPIDNDENSPKFKQAVDYLKTLTNDQVVNVVVKQGVNPSTRATLVTSNKDIAEEMTLAGYTTAAVKENVSAPRSIFKPPQPLRSPRNATPTPGLSKDLEESKMKIASLQSELQNSKLSEEKLKTENEILKQKNIHLEQILAKADTKLKEFSNSLVNSKFVKLVDEVSTLKKLRNGMPLGEGLGHVLTNAVDLLTEGNKSINLKNLTTYNQLLHSETEFLSNLNLIKSSSDKGAVTDLISQRDVSRSVFLDDMNKFLKEIEHVDFDSREQELQNLLSDIKRRYDVSSSNQCDNLSIEKAVQAYEEWRSVKIDHLREMQQNADLCSLTLMNNLEIMKQRLSLKDDAVTLLEMEECLNQSQNIDDLFEKYSKAVRNETVRIKDEKIDIENDMMISNLVSAMLQSINEEFVDIVTLRDKLKIEYESKKEDIEQWMNLKPDISKLKQTRAQLKSLKSKFRHKQADRRDVEEESDEDEKLEKLESEIRLMRTELHKLFCEESKLLGELSKIAEFHFPELNILHPDLGISSFMESNGILHIRDLEHFHHHSMPLISSGSSQPLVFKTVFNEKDCVLKEFSFNPHLDKEILKARVFKFAKCKHPNFVSLDSLFFDKAGRKAYLQTPFYGGENFADFLKKNPSQKSLNEIFHGLLQAVNTLHVTECIHGSISPSKISIDNTDGHIVAILREPNFSKDEMERFENLATFYPVLKGRAEPASKEFDMFCLGLLMFSTYFPNVPLDGRFMNELQDAEGNPILEVIKGLLNENRNERLTAFEAMSNPAFETKNEKQKRHPEELLNTLVDLSDSYAVVELTETNENEQLIDHKPSDEVSSICAEQNAVDTETTAILPSGNTGNQIGNDSGNRGEKNDEILLKETDEDLKAGDENVFE